jgi:DNA gyrase subunit A
VADVRDESDRDGMRLVIMLKRAANASQVIDELHRRTPLQTTFGAILLALDNGEPKELNLKEILERYRDHRIQVIVRRCRFDLEKAEAERHVIEGLLLALDHIDEVVRIIRRSKNREEAAEKLQGKFGLSEIQANAILDMRLAKLTTLEGNTLKMRAADLKAFIRDLKKILASEAEQLRVVREELDEVTKQFGDARRTVIVEGGEEEDAPVESTLADEDVVITLSHEGFAKRMPVHLYRRRVGQGRQLAGMENYETDWLERVFAARANGWLLAFTEGGKAHFLSVLDVPESARASRGQSVYALTGADRSDRIV